MELFRAFGRISLEGAEQVDSALSAAEQSGQAAAESLNEVDSAAASADSSLDSVAGSSGGAASGFDRLASSAETAGRRISSAGGSLTKFVTGPLAALGGVAFLATTQLGNFADEMLDAERATGLSTDALQQWRLLAERAGTDANVITRAAVRLNRELGATGEVSSGTEEALNQLGLTGAQIADLGADERMRLLVSALSDVDDKAQAARIGTEIFGRQWENIAPILANSSEELDKLLQETERFVLDQDTLEQADEFRQGMVELRQELRLVWQEMAVELLPYMQQFTEWLQSDGIPLLQSLAENLAGAAEWFGGLSQGTQSSLIAFVALLAVLGPVLTILGRLVGLVGVVVRSVGVVSGAVGGASAAIGSLASGFGTALAVVARFLPLILRFIPVLGVVVTAITAVIAIFRNWESIVAGFQTVWEAVVGGVSRSIEWVVDRFTAMRDRLTGIVHAIRDRVRDAFNQMRDWVTSAVQSLYDATIGRITRLYRMLVGNSIIPDLRDDVSKVMWEMADDSEDAAGAMASGVEGELSGVDNSMASNGSSAGGGTTTVDLRHATIRDDRDMMRRAYMKGVDMQEAFG